MSLVNRPAKKAVAVTPNDSNQQAVGRALYVGGAGNVTARLCDDSTDVVFNGVPAGTIIPACFLFIRATGTTATGLVTLF